MVLYLMINIINELYLQKFRTFYHDILDDAGNIIATEKFRYVHLWRTEWAGSDQGNLLNTNTGNLRHTNTHESNNGYVRWKIRYGKKLRKRNGNLNYTKYKNYQAHRLIDSLFNGWHWPWRKEVHHINGVKTDNRAENLISLSKKQHADTHCGKAEIVNKKVVYL